MATALNDLRSKIMKKSEWIDEVQEHGPEGVSSSKPKDPIHDVDLEESKTSNAKGRSKVPTRKRK